MKKTKIIFSFIGIAIIGIIISTAITVYTADIGDHDVLTDKGCYGVDYITSGFPIRDIYIRSYEGGECGVTYIEMGNTYIGQIPFLINWIFWSGLVALLPNMVRKWRKS